MTDFTLQEFENRCARIQNLMSDKNINALFICTEAEMRYFTGFRTLFWQSPTRPWFLVIPQKGKPIAIIPEIGADLMRSTWIEKIETWSSPAPIDDGISLLCKILKPFQNIGIAMGREASLRMPLKDFQEMQDTLSDHNFINATPLIDEVRHIKSSEEVTIIKNICTIASKSFADVPNFIHAGMNMREIFRDFKISLLQKWNVLYAT